MSASFRVYDNACRDIELTVVGGGLSEQKTVVSFNWIVFGGADTGVTCNAHFSKIGDQVTCVLQTLPVVSGLKNTTMYTGPTGTVVPPEYRPKLEEIPGSSAYFIVDAQVGSNPNGISNPTTTLRLRMQNNGQIYIGPVGPIGSAFTEDYVSFPSGTALSYLSKFSQ